MCTLGQTASHEGEVNAMRQPQGDGGQWVNVSPHLWPCLLIPFPFSTAEKWRGRGSSLYV